MTPGEWDDAEKRVVHEWMGGDVTLALQQIEMVLDRGNDEQRGRALVYRGSIRSRLATGRPRKAISFWRPVF
jgi:hypothetical protein